jgi:hypothetical protein
MSNTPEWYEDDDDSFDMEDDYETDNGLKNLRKSDRAKGKRIKELETELDTLRKFQRESVIGSVLNSKGVNPKIAAFIPEGIQSDSEAISTWLEENGDVFGIQMEQPEARPGRDEVNLSTLRQIDNAVSNAVSPDDVNDLYSRLNNAESAEDIINMIQGY